MRGRVRRPPAAGSGRPPSQGRPRPPLPTAPSTGARRLPLPSGPGPPGAALRRGRRPSPAPAGTEGREGERRGEGRGEKEPPRRGAEPGVGHPPPPPPSPSCPPCRPASRRPEGAGSRWEPRRAREERRDAVLQRAGRQRGGCGEAEEPLEALREWHPPLGTPSRGCWMRLCAFSPRKLQQNLRFLGGGGGLGGYRGSSACGFACIWCLPSSFRTLPLAEWHQARFNNLPDALPAVHGGVASPHPHCEKRDVSFVSWLRFWVLVTHSPLFLFSKHDLCLDTQVRFCVSRR